jgi:hypothetical protein
MPDLPAVVKERTHLAIVHKGYLRKIVDGSKTIESRFSTIRCAPYNSIVPGETILFKLPGGPILARAQAESVLFFDNLHGDSINQIARRYGEALALEPGFLERRQNARYCTLILLNNVTRTEPLRIQKRDRRGWVVLPYPAMQLSLQDALGHRHSSSGASRLDQNIPPVQDTSWTRSAPRRCDALMSSEASAGAPLQ